MNNYNMNFEEIMEVVKNKIPDVDAFAYQNYIDSNLNLGEIKEVDQYGGEGDGDHWHSVKYFKDHNIYIKVSGYYSSYNGTYFNGWDSCKQVIPQEKTITVYN